LDARVVAGGAIDGPPFVTVPVLSASEAIADPDGDPLRGAVTVARREAGPDTLLDAAGDPAASDAVDCGRGLALEERIGEGIAYIGALSGGPALVDQDLFFACDDGVQDYEIAAGECDDPGLRFASNLPLTGLQDPIVLCVRASSDAERRFSIRVLTILPDRLDLIADRDITQFRLGY